MLGSSWEGGLDGDTRSDGAWPRVKTQTSKVDVSVHREPFQVRKQGHDTRHRIL